MYTEMTGDTPKAKMKAQIDENLKKIYEETLKEDVPDRFKKLLAQLAEKAGRDGGSQ